MKTTHLCFRDGDKIIKVNIAIEVTKYVKGNKLKPVTKPPTYTVTEWSIENSLKHWRWILRG